MTNLQTWTFSGSEVRTVEVNGEPWWVLKDVCTVLELTTKHMTARLEEDEVNQIPLTDSLGREQKTTIIKGNTEDWPEIKEIILSVFAG